MNRCWAFTGVARTALLIAFGIVTAAASPKPALSPPATAPIATPPLDDARTSPPRIRIRGFANGLGRADFASWLKQHPDSDAHVTNRPLAGAGMTAMLNSTSVEFASADRDRNGRVSAQELAGLILSSVDPDAGGVRPASLPSHRTAA